MPEPEILVFSAHAADFCSRAGGTIALYAKRGASIHVVDITFGERGESEDYWLRTELRSEEEAKRTRGEEARAAAAILGATIEFLDYGDYPLLIGRERLERMARVIRARRPDIVLTHWKRDPFNVDHEATADAVLRAAGMAAVPGFDHQGGKVPFPYIFAFEPTVPRNDATGFAPDHYVVIDEVFETKMAALRALRSQTKLVRFYTQWAEYRGFQASQSAGRAIRYAEAFQRYTATVSDRLPAG
ncbi:MAG: PIG-L family deacetylase [Bryobacteraceae bacterium]|nr:PIG-L family deacetylase [Bryobacteraceae bacterium]